MKQQLPQTVVSSQTAEQWCLFLWEMYPIVDRFPIDATPLHSLKGTRWNTNANQY